MTIGQAGDVTIAEPRGRLDTVGTLPFGSHMTTLIRSGVQRIIVDLQHIIFVSSNGIRALLIASDEAGQLGGKVVIRGRSTEIADVFDVARVGRVLTICQTRADQGHSVLWP